MYTNKKIKKILVTFITRVLLFHVCRVVTKFNRRLDRGAHRSYTYDCVCVCALCVFCMYISFDKSIPIKRIYTRYFSLPHSSILSPQYNTHFLALPLFYLSLIDWYDNIKIIREPWECVSRHVHIHINVLLAKAHTHTYHAHFIFSVRRARTGR